MLIRRLLALLLALAVVPGAAAEPPTAEQTAFFEAKIRPVLAKHCYSCHSAEAQQAKKLRGGLLLDTRAGVLKGGDTGPALVAGKPGQSLIIEALRHEGLKMPPKEQLPAAVVADFETWVRLGAPDPRDERATQPKEIDFAAASKHWSFQPIRDVALPAVKERGWVATPVDAFILARLEAAGLSPSPRAERRTLIRRVTYDLVGLPPTHAEVEAFVNDPEPNAYTKVVDRLLSSPHYGERWGRHWLDVARYADTKDGVLMYGDDRIRPFAYTYRDYVVRAFNEDTPYDRFIHEQLAADQLDVEPWRLGAMGLLTLGRMFDGNVHDVIDDRIDTVTRGVLGLTVSCARCHDHKYDPIPTADYYSLYGVFAGCETPMELPLAGAPEDAAGADAFEKQAEPKRQELAKFVDGQYAFLSDEARRRVSDYLVRVATTRPDPNETAIFFFSLSPEDLRPQIAHRWRQFVARRARPDDPVFGLWHDLMQLPDADFANQAGATIKRWQEKPVNPLVRDALAGPKLMGKVDVAKTYGELLRRVWEESKAKPADEPHQQLLDMMMGREAPGYFPKGQTRRYMSRSETDAFGTKTSELDKLAVKARAAAPRAMVLHDMPDQAETQIFVRGNPTQPGAKVPRQFLRIVAGEKRQPFTHGSGRLDLARALTAADNPLTPRVLVNRVWMHHFGEPLVASPSDFGFRSTPPTHPELLDYLAKTFVAEGWSLKKLHRLMVLSATYQQSSLDRPDGRAKDAENRLWWRANRRRLDLEAMRDTLLVAAGRLDGKVGGRPVDIVGDPRQSRRTIYGLVDRQTLPGLFRAFDFASPDQSAERRSFTTVPQQALFGMNSPFVLEQARALAARPEIDSAKLPADRVRALYRLVLARDPEPREIEAAERFVTARGQGSALTPWQQYAQVLLLTNEAMFVD